MAFGDRFTDGVLCIASAFSQTGRDWACRMALHPHMSSFFPMRVVFLMKQNQCIRQYRLCTKPTRTIDLVPPPLLPQETLSTLSTPSLITLPLSPPHPPCQKQTDYTTSLPPLFPEL
jgi:hypothetical protein